MLDKSEIRKQIIEQRKTLSDEFITENSHIITEKLLGLEEYKNSETIFIYMNFGNEVATKDIIIDALANGKKVAIPKIADDRIEFYYITDISNVAPGIWGIPEPNNQNLAMPNFDSVMIMPGVAFDKDRHRIGYGKGYYDSYLSEHEIKQKIALAFDFQVLDNIPFEDYDIKPDLIITEKRRIGTLI